MTDHPLHQAKLKYFSINLYNSFIADTVSQFNKSKKEPKDEEKLLQAFEYLVLQKSYAESPLDLGIGRKNLPSSLDVSDLLICIETIAQSKLRALLEHVCPSGHTSHQKTVNFSETSAFFNRILDSYLETVVMYQSWHFSNIPTLLLDYMVEFSPDLSFYCKMYQLFQVMLQCLPQPNETGARLEGVHGRNLIKAYDRFITWNAAVRFFIENCRTDIKMLMGAISQFRENIDLLEGFFEDYLKTLNHNEFFLPLAKKIFQSFLQEDGECPALKLAWLRKEVPPEARETYFLIQNFHMLVRLVQSRNLSLQALTGFFYTEHNITSMVTEAYGPKNEHEFLVPMKNWGINETNHFIELINKPENIFTDDFAFTLWSIQSIHCLNSTFLDLIRRSPALGMQYTPIIVSVLELWFSNSKKLIHSALKKLIAYYSNLKHEAGDARKNSILSTRKARCFQYIDAILAILEELQSKKLIALQLQLGNLTPILLRYDYITVDIFKAMEAEILNGYTSSFTNYRILLDSKLITFIARWAYFLQEKSFVLALCTNIFSAISTKIQKADELIQSYGLSGDFFFDFEQLNFHAMLCGTTVLSLSCIEFMNTEKRKSLLDSLNLSENLAGFWQLKGKIKRDTPQFRAFGILFLQFFELCFSLQNFRLTTDPKDIFISKEIFEKLLLLMMDYFNEDLRFTDILCERPMGFAANCKEITEYRTILDSTGYTEFVCKNILFDPRVRIFKRNDSPNDYDLFSGAKIDKFRRLLYQHMIDDKSYEKLKNLFKIVKEKVISNAAALRDALLKHREYEVVQMYQRISEFWVNSIIFRTFIRMLEDLQNLEVVKTSNDEALDSELNDCLLSILDILLTLPALHAEPSMMGTLISILNGAEKKIQENCLEKIDQLCCSILDPLNYSLVAELYVLHKKKSLPAADKSRSVADLVFFQELSKSLEVEMKPVALVLLESVRVFLRSIDFKSNRTLKKRLENEELFSKRFESFMELYSYLLENAASASVENLGTKLGVLNKHFLAYFDFCFENAQPMIADRLTYYLRKEQNNDSQSSELTSKSSKGSLAAMCFGTSFVEYYLQDSAKSTQELCPWVQSILTNEKLISLLLDSYASFEHFEYDSLEKTQLEETPVDRQRKISENLKAHFGKRFFDCFVSNKIFSILSQKPVFQTNEKTIQKLIVEAFNGTVKQLKSALKIFDNSALLKGSFEKYQLFFESFLKFEHSLINFAFFSDLEQDSEAQASNSELFYNNILELLLESIKKKYTQTSESILMVILKFCNKNPKALKIIKEEIDRCLKSLQSTAQTSFDVPTNELDDEKKKDLPFLHDLSTFISSYTVITTIYKSEFRSLAHLDHHYIETLISACLNVSTWLWNLPRKEAFSLFQGLTATNIQALFKLPYDTLKNFDIIFELLQSVQDKDWRLRCVDQLYAICLLLLKSDDQRAIYVLNNLQEETFVLHYLYVLFEYDQNKFEKFLNEDASIIIRIFERSAEEEGLFNMLYLFLRSFASDVQDATRMHLISFAINNIDSISLSQQLYHNLLQAFYPELLNRISKEVFVVDRAKLSLNPSSPQSVPCIDPDNINLDPKLKRMIKYLTRVIEITARDKGKFYNIITALSFLITSLPVIVPLLAKAEFEDTPLSEHSNTFQTQLRSAVMKHQTKKLSFLSYLFELIALRSGEVHICLLISAIIEFHSSSYLVLYKGEVLTQPTYHRQLLTDIFLEIFDRNKLLKPRPSDDHMLDASTSTIATLFRDVHLLARRDMENFYKLCNKYFDLLVTLSTPQQQTQVRRQVSAVTSLTKLAEIIKDVNISVISSELFGEENAGILLHEQYEIVKQIQVFYGAQLTLDLAIQSQHGNTLQAKLNPDTLKAISISPDEKSTSFNSGFEFSKLLLVRKALQARILPTFQNISFEYPAIRKGIDFIASKLPLIPSPVKHSSQKIKPVVPKLLGQLRERLRYLLPFKDMLQKLGANGGAVSTQHKPSELKQVYELGQLVKGKLRKHLELRLGDEFRKTLQEGTIAPLMRPQNIEAEIFAFTNTLSKNELIAFLTIADDEILQLFPANFENILASVRMNMMVALLSEKELFQRSNQSVSEESALLTQMRYCFEAEEKIRPDGNYADQLEGYFAGDLDYRTNWLKKRTYYKSITQHRYFELQRDFSFSLYAFDLLSEANYQIKFDSKQLELLLVPAKDLEKWIFPLVLGVSHLFKVALTKCITAMTLHPANEIRFIDLLLYIQSLPKSKNKEFIAEFVSYFNLHEFKQLAFYAEQDRKVLINDLIDGFFFTKLKIDFATTQFDALVKKAEKYFGVLPFKKHLQETNLLPEISQSEGTLIQRLLLNTVVTPERKLLGCLLPFLIEYLNSIGHLPPKDDQLVATIIESCKRATRGLDKMFRISKIYLYRLVKNPWILAFIVENLVCSEEFFVRFEKASELSEKAKTKLTFVNLPQMPGVVMAKTDLPRDEAETLLQILTCSELMIECLIQVLQEMLERLGRQKYYSMKDIESLHECNKLLEGFMKNTRVLRLQKTLVVFLQSFESHLGNIEKFAYEPAFEMLFGSIIQYTIYFYKLYQIREDFYSTLVLSEGYRSPALYKIKFEKGPNFIEKKQQDAINNPESKKTEENEITTPGLISRTIGFYLNKGVLNDMTLSMVPWLVPSDVKKDFIKRKISGLETQVLKKFYVNRETIVEDTLTNFNALPKNLIGPGLKVAVEFINEVGVDQGGLTKEWVSLILKELLDPQAGLFVLSANQVCLQPSPVSAIVPDNVKYFQLIGRLIGYAIANNIPTNENFTKPMIKQLLELPLTLSDLADVDPDLTNSLDWILENEFDPKLLSQEFSFEYRFFDESYNINLVEGADFKEVNEKNKKIFVKELVYHKLIKSIEIPIHEILMGIYDFVPDTCLKLFTSAELHSLLAGEHDVDPTEMMKYAKYSPNPPSQQVIDWFWEIVGEMSKGQLSALLFFISGNSIVGFGGFKEHPITINKSGASPGSLPVAHTCYSMIDLPEYNSKETMREKLLKAVLEGQGYFLA